MLCLLEPEAQLFGHEEEVIVGGEALLAGLLHGGDEFLPDVLDAFILC